MTTTKHLPKIFLGLAVVMLGLGTFVALRQHQQNVQIAKQVMASGQSAPSTIKPKPSDFDNYKVAGDLPRYIFIPSLNVKAIVRSLGVTKDNAVAAPTNIYDAGWFNRSSKPGQPGAMLIDGHISSWSTNGIFHDLNKLKAGDTIQVEKGDGTILAYRVVKSQTYEVDKVDMAAVLAPVTEGKNGLNLITCSGRVIKGTNEFDKRLVVFAEQN